MTRSVLLKAVLAGSVCSAALLTAASARNFAIPGGDLESALSAYAAQSGVSLLVSDDQVKGVRSKGASGDMSDDAALSHILSGTGFVVHRHPSGKLGIAREEQSSNVGQGDFSMQLAQASPPSRPAVETVTVTSSKLGGGDVQSIPIAITALSQEQLTATQTAGGPDLIKEVPNMTFTKTNFSGYSIQIRGIGTQAISVTTDPAVAIAFNDIPFIRNHFFEQEFYDVSSVDVLRGPQGTLYGRNATAGVVNLVSAKPTDQFEAMASVDLGNYQNRRFEGMINLPIVDDRFDLRVAGEWTKRDGYSTNDITNQPVDGRDLWSSRVTMGWKPTSDIQTYLIWEHFSEDDNRIRSSKQLCTPVPVPTELGGMPVGTPTGGTSNGDFLSQGCGGGSLYSPAAFGVPVGQTLPFWTGLGIVTGLQQNSIPTFLSRNIDPYQGTTQSTNLRVISSQLNPTYRAKNDTLELNADWRLTPSLTFTSQTGYNRDFLWSAEDYDRFNTAPGVFTSQPSGYGLTNTTFWNQRGIILPDPVAGTNGVPAGAGIFCDPQLGCSDRLLAEDLSDEHAWQLSQEFRLASNFDGPLNFSAGGNYLHYETEENYYVFINALSLIALAPVYAGDGTYENYSGSPIPPYQSGVTTNDFCMKQPHQYGIGGGQALNCTYIDPNPIGSLNNEGHNYFLSQNPYVLNSYAAFGELYYNVTKDFKLTAGGRWTEDQKHFTDIPSEVLTPGYGYPTFAVTNQKWDALTGRLVADWTPDLSFTDKTLIYGSISHGYKAGGANPPGAELLTSEITPGAIINPIHPATFKPEYIDAFELGTKNSLLDDSLTLNSDVFYYDYTGYQISRIVDRTAINDNFNATVRGAELELKWEAAPGLKFGFAGGYENATLDKGQESVDLMDRTGGQPGWSVVRPFVTEASNCILPNYVIFTLINGNTYGGLSGLETACGVTYGQHVDPVTGATYVATPPGYVENTHVTDPPGPNYGVQYPGFDPFTVPNNGQGFDKDLSGHQLPNAPHFTTSFSAEYSLPLSPDWAATLHGDFYWQSQQWARVFEDPIDKINPYSTTNLALIFTNQNGWQVMGYVKNVFNVTAITGTFLNSDDTDLTTNIFLTDPRLIGVRVTKNW